LLVEVHGVRLLTDPEWRVAILALPVAGSWLKLSEAVDYALKLKPDSCFPVHDAILKNSGLSHRAPAEILPKSGIVFTVLEDGNAKDFI